MQLCVRLFVMLIILVSLINGLKHDQGEKRTYNGPQDLTWSVTDLRTTLQWQPDSDWKDFNHSYEVETCLSHCYDDDDRWRWVSQVCEEFGDKEATKCFLRDVWPTFCGIVKVRAVILEEHSISTYTNFSETNYFCVEAYSYFSPPIISSGKIESHSITVTVKLPEISVLCEYEMIPFQLFAADVTDSTEKFCSSLPPSNNLSNFGKYNTSIELGDRDTCTETQNQAFLKIGDLSSGRDYCIHGSYIVLSYDYGPTQSDVGYIRVKTLSDHMTLQTTDLAESRRHSDMPVILAIVLGALTVMGIFIAICIFVCRLRNSYQENIKLPEALVDALKDYTQLSCMDETEIPDLLGNWKLDSLINSRQSESVANENADCKENLIKSVLTFPESDSHLTTIPEKYVESEISDDENNVSSYVKKDININVSPHGYIAKEELLTISV